MDLEPAWHFCFYYEKKPQARIALATFSLPRKRSTTEPLRRHDYYILTLIYLKLEVLGEAARADQLVPTMASALS